MKEEFEKMAAAGKLPGRLIERLVTLTKSRFVMHRNWGLGQIRRVDPAFSRVTVDFPGKPGHSINLEFAVHILKPATREDATSLEALPLQHLNWKLLPPGEAGLKALRQYVQNSATRRQKSPSFDITRLKFLLDLRPNQIYAGMDEFDGYLAFLFPAVSGAVLENPVEGNAVYVFDDNWRELSKISKSELFQEQRQHFRRIVHTGDWQSRLRNEIKLGARPATEPRTV